MSTLLSTGTRRSAGGARIFLALLVGLFLLATLRAAEEIPPRPRDHFNDYAGVVAPTTARQLNAQLAQFERDTSNQIVVAIFPKMRSDSSIEDYTVRVAQAWGAGQKQRDNGAVLFMFVEDRALYIQVGYGLEGALPDALCKRIIEDEIIPRLRQGDTTAAMTAGVRAMLAAAKGEYRGTGRLAAGGGRVPRGMSIGAFIFILVIVIVSSRLSRRRGMMYGRGGRRSIWLGGPGRLGVPGRFGGFGGFGGGRGGGTFSGGGGSFGGGGAGGRW